MRPIILGYRASFEKQKSWEIATHVSLHII